MEDLKKKKIEKRCIETAEDVCFEEGYIEEPITANLKIYVIFEHFLWREE